MLIAFNYNLKAMSKRLSEVGTYLVVGTIYHVTRHIKNVSDSPQWDVSQDLPNTGWALYILSYEQLQHYCIQGDIVDNGNFERVAK